MSTILKGLRTIVYHVSDLTVAKAWYQQVFGIEPYFDETFYVGYSVGGFELGLDPDPSGYAAGNSAITYWGIEDIDAFFANVNSLGIKIHELPKNVGEAIWLGSIYDPFGNVIGLIENPSFGV